MHPDALQICNVEAFVIGYKRDAQAHLTVVVFCKGLCNNIYYVRASYSRFVLDLLGQKKTKQNKHFMKHVHDVC